MCGCVCVHLMKSQGALTHLLEACFRVLQTDLHKVNVELPTSVQTRTISRSCWEMLNLDDAYSGTPG